jgi:hypothetical protein
LTVSRFRAPPWWTRVGQPMSAPGATRAASKTSAADSLV